MLLVRTPGGHRVAVRLATDVAEHFASRFDF
jgi:hypothetical protein